VHAPVVRGEDDDGVAGEPLVVEGLEHAADGGVERLDEGGVGRVEGFRVGGDRAGRRRERNVRVVKGEVEQEGSGLVALDELHREVRLAKLALAALRRLGPGIGAARVVLVEAMLGWRVILAAEVPFADRRADVAAGFEQFGEGRDAVGQGQVDRSAEEPVRRAVGAAGKEGRDLEPRGVLTGQQRGARRGAD
jgi:hypothetical protein